MRTVVNYDTTGNIVSRESWSFAEDPNPDAGSAGVITIKEGEAPDNLNSREYFVDTSISEPALKSKDVLDSAHSVSGLTAVFTALPVGTVVKVDGTSVISDTTDTEIEFELPGVYRIKLSPPPRYLDKTMEVTING